jgi:type I restriction enzyme S subunit
MPRANMDQVGGLRVPNPPLSEQRAIATFLDQETAKLDALTRKFEQLLDRLEERRAALISHAVTKGLDPDAEMKDSGIPWLGEIPAHWDSVRIRHVARLESGHTPSRQHPEYWEDCYIPWFSLADVWQIRSDKQVYVEQTKELVSEIGLANSSARLLPKGTVILSRTASVGFSGVMACPMATTQDFANWICGENLMPEYLLFTFRAMRPEFNRLIMGSTHKTIYMPDIVRLSMALPPIEEQQIIVRHILRETAKINALTDKIHVVIDRLDEYRTAFITAAVTGKIDVRNTSP